MPPKNTMSSEQVPVTMVEPQAEVQALVEPMQLDKLAVPEKQQQVQKPAVGIEPLKTVVLPVKKETMLLTNENFKKQQIRKLPGFLSDTPEIYREVQIEGTHSNIDIVIKTIFSAQSLHSQSKTTAGHRQRDSLPRESPPRTALEKQEKSPLLRGGQNTAPKDPQKGSPGESPPKSNRGRNSPGGKTSNRTSK
ncbi:hypothetical protein BY996DRAFT_6423957 [Phakopsora pachyrhizi]|nr:hypothetical protein BY996DRAFT_6423957 [Phakopsora pachyrhizi]